MKKMDHIEYPESLKKKSETEILYIIKDAREAIRAMPDGENVGYYQDEVNYCVNELYFRRKQVEGNS